MRRPVLVLFCLVLAQPGFAYDYPLSIQMIRDAYFFGRRPSGFNDEFASKYRRALPALKVEDFVTEVKIETPFFQIADHTSKTPDYAAQDAVKDFYEQPVAFRVLVEVCYSPQAAPPKSVKITVTQNRKTLTPLSDERRGFFPPSDFPRAVPSIGEKAKLIFDAQGVDSSTVTVNIETPEGQSASAAFDLQELR